MTRRHALRVIGAGVGVGASAVLVACKSEAEKPATTKKAAAPKKAAPPKKSASCNSVGPIDDKSKNMRKTLQYVEKSTKPGKNCANCAQWLGDKFPDSKCGGCKLFSGGVNPEGNCLSHAPMKAG
ncbi:MAG: high-potential iron-sulfur protein [Deltaproteobacteria bacterium]